MHPELLQDSALHYMEETEEMEELPMAMAIQEIIMEVVEVVKEEVGLEIIILAMVRRVWSS
jgi:hypothetical protein